MVDHQDDYIAGGGNFQSRLRTAQHASVDTFLPGSNVPVITGIALVDPKTQGIAATVHKIQRLFGVTSPHCVDVEVWRSMTMQELADRHVSPRDMERTAKNYDCDDHCATHAMRPHSKKPDSRLA